MSWFSEALPKDMRLTTLIMDETSFSAEISAADRQALDAFYQRLQDRFPGKVTFSPTSGTSGTRTLLSGLYDSPVAPVSASAATAQGILANLQSHASTTGVQIIDSGADSPRQRADQKNGDSAFRQGARHQQRLSEFYPTDRTRERRCAGIQSHFAVEHRSTE
jgi:hypothetical protein